MRVLIVKLSSLGDVIQTLPVLHDLAARFPGVQMDWVVEEAFADLLRLVPGIGRVLPCAQRRWRKTPFSSQTRAQWRQFWQDLRAQPYDVVIDFQGLIKSARVARSARLSAQGFSVTYGNRSELCAYEWPVRWMLDRTVPMERRLHAVARYRLLAARALGYETDPLLQQAPVYPLVSDPSARQPAIFLAHGTTRLDNEWPAQAWLALGQHWKALAGLRFDRFRQSQTDRRRNQTQNRTDFVASPRLGLVYQPNAAHALYVNLSRSFQPVGNDLFYNDSNLAQVKRGLAWHYKQYQREQSPPDQQSYAAAEIEARAAKLGLWRDADPVPPWEFRHKGKP